MTREPLFKVGEIVQLRSGGPRMVVQAVDDNKDAKPPPPPDPEDLLAQLAPAKPGKWVKPPRKIRYNCQWFAGKKNLEEEFDEEVLMTLAAEATVGADR